MKKIISGCMAAAIVSMTGAVSAETCDPRYYSPEWDAQPPKVDAYNYVRAETDIQFMGYVENYKAFGKLAHSRKAYDVDNQVTLSGNRDTIYSFGIFDLSKSPLNITLPEVDGRYMSLMVMSENHDINPAQYAPRKIVITEKEVGTRYIFIAVRTFADPNSKEDMDKAHKLQDMIKVEQKDKGDPSGLPKWDKEAMLRLRKAYNTLGSSLSSSETFFGVRCDRSYLQNAMGVAVGWGGLQRKDALYIPTQVPKNDGKTAYVLTVPEDVPVDGFWSVTVYNQERFMVKNKYNAYSFNNVTAKKGKDGSITIHFGGDPKADNYLPIMDGWLYIVRFYKPKAELLEGKWKFPEAVEAK
jgi:hypothetical protein